MLSSSNDSGNLEELDFLKRVGPKAGVGFSIDTMRKILLCDLGEEHHLISSTEILDGYNNVIYSLTVGCHKEIYSEKKYVIKVCGRFGPK